MKTYTKKLATFALAVCLIGAYAGFASADSNTIDVTVTAQASTFTFDCNVSTWAIGSQSYGSGEYTKNTIEVNNTGDGPIDIEIKLTNPTDWTHATEIGSWGGDDVYMMNASAPTDTYATSTSAVNGIDTSDSSGFIAALQATDGGDISTFDLTFLMPASGTTTSEQTITITLTSSASAS